MGWNALVTSTALLLLGSWGTSSSSWGVGQVWAQRASERPLDYEPSPVEVFVDVHNHPKTGFSCEGKTAGEYYADAENRCAVYYICITTPNSQLAPQSFACPNGTLFSQSSRTCNTADKVYCPLATRYYDSVHGVVDSQGAVPSQSYYPNPHGVNAWNANPSAGSYSNAGANKRERVPAENNVELPVSRSTAAPPPPPSPPRERDRERERDAPEPRRNPRPPPQPVRSLPVRQGGAPSPRQSQSQSPSSPAQSPVARFNLDYNQPPPRDSGSDSRDQSGSPSSGSRQSLFSPNSLTPLRGGGGGIRRGVRPSIFNVDPVSDTERQGSTSPSTPSTPSSTTTTSTTTTTTTTTPPPPPPSTSPPQSPAQPAQSQPAGNGPPPGVEYEYVYEDYVDSSGQPLPAQPPSSSSSRDQGAPVPPHTSGDQRSSAGSPPQPQLSPPSVNSFQPPAGFPNGFRDILPYPPHTFRSTPLQVGPRPSVGDHKPFSSESPQPTFSGISRPAPHPPRPAFNSFLGANIGPNGLTGAQLGRRRKRSPNPPDNSPPPFSPPSRKSTTDKSAALLHFLEADSRAGHIATNFSCYDKVPGFRYADLETDCAMYHVCIPVGKGKMADHQVRCAEGQEAFDQETGSCQTRETVRACSASPKYWIYNQYMKPEDAKRGLNRLAKKVTH